MSLFRGAAAHDVADRTEDVLLSEDTTFTDLLISKPILHGLHAAGFRKPSPIQLSAIPIGRLGKDLIVHAKSGTGKTLVFTIVALEMIDLAIDKTQVLILAPTREIAVQIKEVIKTIGLGFSGLNVGVFIGGLSIAKDIVSAKTCHIAVGTPGRIKQLISQGQLNLTSVRLLVLDEADRLVEDSFRKDVRCIFSKLPEHKQTLVVSATFPQEMEAFLSQLLVSPQRVQPTVDNLLVGIRQFAALTPSHTNIVARVGYKTAVVVRILSSVSLRQCLIFCNVQSRMESISRNLSSKGWPCIHLAGSMQQQDRLAAISAIQNQRCRVLLTTDLASRGIDVEQVDVVINMDLPYDSETFLHRIGRAGRYGGKAIAVTIVEKGAELTAFQNLLYDIGGEDYHVPCLPTGDWPREVWNGHDDLEIIKSVKKLQSVELSEEAYANTHAKVKNKCKADTAASKRISNFQHNANSCNIASGNSEVDSGNIKSVLEQLFIKTEPKPLFRSYTEIEKCYKEFKTSGEIPVNFFPSTTRSESSSCIIEHEKLVAAMSTLNLDEDKTTSKEPVTKESINYDCMSSDEVLESSDDGGDDNSSSSFDDFCDDELRTNSNDRDVSSETGCSYSSDSEVSDGSSCTSDVDISERDSNARKGSAECRTCNNWFRDWRQSLWVKRQLHQRKIYMEEMLK